MLDLENQEWLLSITELFRWNGILEWDTRNILNCYKMPVSVNTLVHSVASLEVLYVACRGVFCQVLWGQRSRSTMRFNCKAGWYVLCVLLLCRGPSGLVIRASDWYSEGSNPSWSQNFSVDWFLSLSITNWHKWALTVVTDDNDIPSLVSDSTMTGVWCLLKINALLDL